MAPTLAAPIPHAADARLEADRLSDLLPVGELEVRGRIFQEQRVDGVFLDPRVGQGVTDSLDVERDRAATFVRSERRVADTGDDGLPAHVQRPSNFGARFSANAAAPSRTSSLLLRICATSCSMRRPAAMLIS